MSLKTDMSETMASFLTVMATSGSHSLHSARSFFSPSTYGGIYDIKFIHEVYTVKHTYDRERHSYSINSNVASLKRYNFSLLKHLNNFMKDPHFPPGLLQASRLSPQFFLWSQSASVHAWRTEMQWSVEGEGLKVEGNMCASIGIYKSTLKDTLIHCPFTYLSKHINHNNIQTFPTQ